MPGTRPRTRPRRDRGTVTAEIAVALPCLVVVLAVALACVQAATTQLECVDAARIGARALARGQDPSAVRSLVSRVGPRDAVVELSLSSGFAHVSVTAPVRILSGASPPFRVGGTASIPTEPDS
ncbi:hypothetical protein EV190_101680 [Actinorugispora endophytica]|uniref:TadE-like protein n=1 Tax=Actinorugispora endophytica TaxID=1605990 RepID=A0A4R6V4X9_9ACTN|nr:hypothetical protein EV190_101680 [Actinorugispora endophytica]